VILTSGTTGRPKGAARGSPSSAGPGVALLSRIPYRVRDTTVIAPPLFHAWGLGNMGLALAMGSTMVLRRRFDAATFLADIEAHRARVAVVVPVMLQRVLDLDDDERTGFDTSSLEVVAASGSAVSGALAARFMDEFGDVLYNLYGSTEVAFATIAGPEQLRAAPGTAGTPPTGTRVAILDDQGLELPRGRRGRIFVGNDMTVSGYTSGSGKTVIRGLVDSGDTGYFDPGGRLFVEGRSDDMIVSGGENVFPQEVEETLAEHADVAEVAVVGVDDEKFGQRLVAFVVPRAGAAPDPDALKAHVRDRLANYKVPRQIELVDELPRNPTGKILKRDLADGLTADSG
jgi:fatty-acyl-CoA synthase